MLKSKDFSYLAIKTIIFLLTSIGLFIASQVLFENKVLAVNEEGYGWAIPVHNTNPSPCSQSLAVGSQRIVVVLRDANSGNLVTGDIYLAYGGTSSGPGTASGVSQAEIDCVDVNDGVHVGVWNASGYRTWDQAAPGQGGSGNRAFNWCCGFKSLNPTQDRGKTVVYNIYLEPANDPATITGLAPQGLSAPGAIIDSTGPTTPVNFQVRIGPAMTQCGGGTQAINVYLRVENANTGSITFQEDIGSFFSNYPFGSTQTFTRSLPNGSYKWYAQYHENPRQCGFINDAIPITSQFPLNYFSIVAPGTCPAGCTGPVGTATWSHPTGYVSATTFLDGTKSCTSSNDGDCAINTWSANAVGGYTVYLTNTSGIVIDDGNFTANSSGDETFRWDWAYQIDYCEVPNSSTNSCFANPNVQHHWYANDTATSRNLPSNTLKAGKYYAYQVIVVGRTQTREIKAGNFQATCNCPNTEPPTPEPTDNTLNVRSSGVSGVSIFGTQSGTSGTTNYTVSTTSNISTNLTAPATSGGMDFSSWIGCDSVAGAVCTANVSGGASQTVTAHYVSVTTPPPATVGPWLQTKFGDVGSQGIIGDLDHAGKGSGTETSADYLVVAAKQISDTIPDTILTVKGWLIEDYGLTLPGPNKAYGDDGDGIGSLFEEFGPDTSQTIGPNDAMLLPGSHGVYSYSNPADPDGTFTTVQWRDGFDHGGCGVGSQNSVVIFINGSLNIQNNDPDPNPQPCPTVIVVKGKITVDPGVTQIGSTTAGVILISDKEFSSGNSAQQLTIYGAVYSSLFNCLVGPNFQRVFDHTSGPAELIEFNPRVLWSMTNTLGITRTTYTEINP